MVPSSSREKAHMEDMFYLSDMRFELFNPETLSIGNKRATPSEMQVIQSCPVIINVLGMRVFSDSSVMHKLTRILKLPQTTVASKDNIDDLNAKLKAVNRRRLLHISKIKGTAPDGTSFSELFLMDIVDPRKIKKEKETSENYDR